MSRSRTDPVTLAFLPLSLLAALRCGSNNSRGPDTLPLNGADAAAQCMPVSCAQMGAACGTQGDGCGGTLDCGSCAAPSTCGGSVPNQCGVAPDGGPCVPATCKSLGANCGTVGDGCGGVLSCGACSAPQTCGGGGSPGVCGAGAPALVQHVSASSTRNNTFSSPNCFYYQLPEPTVAGNAVVVGFTYNGNPTPRVTDDKGNSYAVAQTHYDSANRRSVGIAGAFHVAGGTRQVSLCFNSDPGGNVQPLASEFQNVVGFDGAGTGGHGSGTSAAAGSLTPTASGDLVFQVAASLSQSQQGFTPAAPAGGALLSADRLDGLAAQYAVSTGTAAITPTLGLKTGDKWASAAVLLKAGMTGGTPGGLHVMHLVHENVPFHTSSGGTGNPFPNPTTLQLPCSGNLLVAMIGGGNASETVTGITDTNHNTWKQAGNTYILAGNDTVQTYYAASAACSSDLTLTMRWTGSGGDFTIFFYDVRGVAAAPFDTAVGGTGSQGSNGSLTLPFKLTPARANEIVFSEVIWDYNTGSGLVGQSFDTNTFSGENISGPEPVDENNGWGHVIATSTSPIGFTWTTIADSPPVGNWAAMAVAFKGQ